MRIKEIKKYQSGGPMAGPGAAPAEGGAPVEGGTPEMGGEDQLAQIAGQVLQSLLETVQDPNVVMQILQLAIEMLQQSIGGAQEAPVFKKGGKLAKKSKKACGGMKMK